MYYTEKIQQNVVHISTAQAASVRLPRPAPPPRAIEKDGAGWRGGVGGGGVSRAWPIGPECRHHVSGSTEKINQIDRRYTVGFFFFQPVHLRPPRNHPGGQPTDTRPLQSGLARQTGPPRIAPRSKNGCGIHTSIYPSPGTPLTSLIRGRQTGAGMPLLQLEAHAMPNVRAESTQTARPKLRALLPMLRFYEIFV